MRIKIKGEVTAERLAEALQLAMDRYADVRPGSRIFGANLYVSGFDVDGMPFELADSKGNLLSLELSADAGTMVRPALTAEGEARRQLAKERAAKKEAEARLREQIYQEEANRRRREYEEKVASARQTLRFLNERTQSILSQVPERFVTELNAAVTGVWEGLKPIEPHGPRKGEPRPCPYFVCKDEQLFLVSESWLKPKAIKNPAGVLRNDTIEPFWRNETWEAATIAIMAVLESFVLGDGSSRG